MQTGSFTLRAVLKEWDCDSVLSHSVVAPSTPLKEQGVKLTFSCSFSIWYIKYNGNMILRNRQCYHIKEPLIHGIAVTSAISFLSQQKLSGQSIWLLKLSCFEGFIRRLRGKSDLFHVCWRRNIGCPEKCITHIHTHSLHLYGHYHPDVGHRKRTEEKRRELEAKRWENNSIWEVLDIVLMFNIQSWPLLGQTSCVPTWVSSALTWPTVSLSAICHVFSAPTRDSGTQLARDTNWIQSCSL